MKPRLGEDCALCENCAFYNGMQAVRLLLPPPTLQQRAWASAGTIKGRRCTARGGKCDEDPESLPGAACSPAVAF